MSKIVDFIKRESLNIFVVLLVIVLSGVGGWIYEVLFYRIDLGRFVNRGVTVGPWIPIYGLGGLLMAYTTYKIRAHKIAVFLTSFFVCGALEFVAGWLLLHLFGVRLWDYNVEIWNFGNIGGFVCLRSCAFFGLCGLFVNYSLIPMVRRTAEKIPPRVFNPLAVALCVLFALDTVLGIIFNLFLHAST